MTQRAIRWRRMGVQAVAALPVALGACNRHQSALRPFGEDAADIAGMTVVMVVGAVVIALGVAALMWRATHSPEHAITHRQGMRMVLWLGAIVPTIVLAALLIWALPAMRPRSVAPADLRIAVEGEQFWWRVAYRPANGPQVVSANEVRIPVGRTVAFELTGGDILHSFWIPGLAGKMDMIPGRTNSLVVRATRPGRYRGVCTEFCGLSHALMAFDVLAVEPAAFDAWMADQRRPVATVADARGARLFAANGCGGCHAIRGTAFDSRIGPDLSRFGARPTLGAGILDPSVTTIAAFIRAPQDAKPGVRMPAYPQLRDEEAAAIARYLKGLR